MQTSSGNNIAMVNWPHLLAGTGAITSAMLSSSFSKVFQIVIPLVNPTVADAVEGGKGRNNNSGGGGGSRNSNSSSRSLSRSSSSSSSSANDRRHSEPDEDVVDLLRSRYQDFIASEERKMRGRIEAFKSKQMEQFKKLQSKGTDDELKMYQLVASLGVENGSGSGSGSGASHDSSAASSPAHSPRVKTPQLRLFSSADDADGGAAASGSGSESEDEYGMFAFDDSESGKLRGGKGGSAGSSGSSSRRRGRGGSGGGGDSDSDFDGGDGDGGGGRGGAAPVSPTAAGMLGTSLTRSSLPIDIPMPSPSSSVPRGSLPRSSVPRGSIPVGSFKAAGTSFIDSNQHIGSAREFSIRSRQASLSSERRRSSTEDGDIEPGSPPK